MFVVSILSFRILGLFAGSYFDDWGNALKFGVAVILLFLATAHWNLRGSDSKSEVHPEHANFKVLIILTGWLEFVLAILIVFPLTSNVASILAVFLLLAMIPARLYALNQGYFLGNDNVCNTDYRPYILHVTLIMITVLTGIFPNG